MFPVLRCEAELSRDELEQTNALLEQRRAVLSGEVTLCRAGETWKSLKRARCWLKLDC